jgi:hypothetical protein
MKVLILVDSWEPKAEGWILVGAEGFEPTTLCSQSRGDLAA